MNFLRQSTAVDIGIGPFIDDDGITPATGLSITQAETRLKKNNGAWAQASDNTTATHEEEGWYEKELDATDTDTCGILIVAVYIAGNLAWHARYQVVEEAVYDAFYAASSTGLVGTAQTGDCFARLGAPAGASVSADVAAVKTQTAAIETDTQDIQSRLPAALVSGRIDASVGAMAANVLTAAAINADAFTAAKFAADVTTELQSGLATAASITSLDGKIDTIDNFLDTEIAAIKAVTDALPDAGALTSIATQASVNTIDDFLDTEVAAIKAKTDQLTFGQTNTLNVRVTWVLDEQLALAGTGGQLIGTAP